jgi:serine/threonine protein kinase
LVAVKQGTMYGHWRLCGKISGGGNGEVYRCQSPDGTLAAIKILKRGRDRRGDRMPRFRNEIRFLTERKNYPGVLPMLDHALPAETDQPSWYVMPIATPLRKALGQSPQLPAVVDAIGHIAHTLAGLATDGVEGHRDIKPDNLFELDGQPVIGDFGLVKYPEQHTGTRQGQPLGPADFMAPEMRRCADTAQAQPADVYSLAKTLWALAAGERYPPLGELRRDRDNQRLSGRVDDLRAILLDPLIEDCTSDGPADRPAMVDLAKELTLWSSPGSVPTQADLSAYADEVARLHDANLIRGETREERRSRLYSEALRRAHQSLTLPLMATVKQSGLHNAGSAPENFKSWPGEAYGGSTTMPCWGIATLTSPILVAAIAVLRKLPEPEDTTNLLLGAMIATVTEHSQHTYFQQLEPFRAGSSQLDHALTKLSEKINTELRAIIAHYLTICREQGIPQIKPTQPHV